MLHLHWRADGIECDEMLKPDIWHCEFAPTLPSDKNHVNLLASCGSNSVCFTDCSQGRVVSKYTHMQEPNEIFACLTWAAVTEENMGVETQSHIVAVAGQAKSIKLLHVRQGICYGYLRGHTAEINDLKFTKDMSDRLLSASSDKTVRLWGVPLPSEEDAGGVCLAIFDALHQALCISISPTNDAFACGNEDAAVAIYDLPSLLDNVLLKGKQRPKHYLEGKDFHISEVDDIAWIDDNLILSKGCVDSVMLWDKTSTDASGCPKSTFAGEFPDLGMFPCRGAIVSSGNSISYAVGTQEGILVYDLPTVKVNNIKRSPIPQKPVHTLIDDRMQHTVRCTAISPDLKFIAVTDSQDCLWIWSNQS